ncbi:MAG: Gfo/Idh/MocA family oxidoreductase [Ruminococcaceae bacterium]|nr:Gfo/Idh/MocA family oxidoreductase [Oscillospiraceae bacterium]
MSGVMNKKCGFGIIGCGLIANWHADSITGIDDAQLIGVTDVNLQNASRFAAKYGCRTFDSVDEMLACDDIEAVCICTPSGLHASIAVKVALAGKHFAVEKPFAITKEQISEVIAACEKNNVKGAVISQFRFSEAINHVKNAIECGALGDLILGDVYMKYYRSSEYYSSSSWKGTWAMDGGGALMNQGIHGIDILQYLMGPVKSVYGVCKTLVRDIEVEDTANLVLEYENGAIGTIQGTTSVSPGYPRRMEISGTKGTVILTEAVITTWDVEGYEPPASATICSGTKSFNDPAALATTNHKKQLADLVEAIRDDRPPVVDIYEGKKPVDIILAAYESSRTKKVIYLS